MKKRLAAIAASIICACAVLPAFSQMPDRPRGWGNSLTGLWIHFPSIAVDSVRGFEAVTQGGALIMDIDLRCGWWMRDGVCTHQIDTWAFVVITELPPCMHVELRPPAHVVLGKTMKVLDEYDSAGHRTWALVPDPQGPAAARVSLQFERRCDVS